MIFDDKIFNTILGRKLREYRGERFTLDQLIQAACLGISRSSLSAIENGIQDISAKDLYAISVVLKFSLSEFMEEIQKDLFEEKFSLNLNR
jgi:transcriptional regulator with XRE-family HTH domain